MPVVVITDDDDASTCLQIVRCGVQDVVDRAGLDSASLECSLMYAVERRRTLVTERHQRHQRAAVQAAERVLQIVGHELRSPLAALRAMTEFLQSQIGRPDASWDEYLRSIHGEVTRMGELVNNMLEAARLNSGRITWHWSAVSVDTVCEDVIELMHPFMSHQSVDMHYAPDASHPVLRGDVDAIRRLVLNLVANSVKYTSEGRIDLGARRFVDSGRSWVEITVQDTGAGMCQSVISKLGEPFVISSAALGSDYVKGTGLGLFICKAIVAAHGGTLTVRSSPGQGCTIQARMRADLAGPVRPREGVSRRTHDREAA